ncbi:MAG: pilin [Patescibacteria group bacterium]|nr:pilin [Patescibacteria group bacterium]
MPKITQAAFLEYPSGTNLPGEEGSGDLAVGVVKNLMYWLLGLLGFIGVIGFVIAGILYLTSAGNDERMEKAKKSMIYCVLGVVISLGALVLIEVIFNLLQADSRA